MDSSQPITRTRRRTSGADPSLSRFEDSGSDDRVATRSTTKRLAAARAEKPQQRDPRNEMYINSHLQTSEVEPPTVGEPTRDDFAGLDSVTSALESSSLSDNPNDTMALSSQRVGSTPLAGPMTVEALAARRRQKVTTYKQHRSLRLHPTEDENKLSLRSREITRSITTPTSTPSCSPAPTDRASKYRKRRRRQVPLKHRLAKAARSRLPPSLSQELHSQPPICVLPEPPEEDELPIPSEVSSSFAPEDKPAAVPDSNVVQRHLTAPRNYTIPDLKDLLGSTHQPFPTAPDDPTDAEPQKKSFPQFVLPPNNNLHSPKPRVDPKRGRPGKRDLPRLSFVPLEAHQEQATGRPMDKRVNQVVQAQRVPLTAQAPSTSVRSDIHTFDTPPPAPPTNRVNFLTPDRNRSPSRILVKGTPEPDSQLLHLYPNIADGPSFVRASKSSPIRPTHTLKNQSNPTSDSGQLAPHLYGPMTNLLDDLTRLAKSAAQMNSKSFITNPKRPSQKRTHQANLTKDGYLSDTIPETGAPAKVRRLR